MSTVLVASTGGHLSELVKLAPRFELDEPPTWVTFDNRQARTLLAGQKVIYVDYTGPRDYVRVARNCTAAQRLFAGGEVKRVVSTGAGIALSFLPLARAHGLEAHYIESAARPVGPSLTGRLLSQVPGIRLHTQFSRWARRPWMYSGSVYDGFATHDAQPAHPRPLKLALTLGTLRFPFERLVDRIYGILPDDVEVVLWQVGATQSPNGRVVIRSQVAPTELLAAHARADVVVCHGGVGSALEALDVGFCPVVVPRRARYGEHVDDHQVPLAQELGQRGLAIYREAEDVTYEDLVTAASRSVRLESRPPPFALN